MTVLTYSFLAIVTGFALDLLFGDPQQLPHIVRGMGRLIAALERRLPRTVGGGVALVIIVTLLSYLLPLGLVLAAYHYRPWLGFLLESFLAFQLLAARSLQRESMKVYRRLTAGDLPGARRDLSMIVGRDTAALDEAGICRAAVETIAENTADGVTAPLLYLAVGGAPLGSFYKSVNTLDSMLGYKNERYIKLGRAAARTDDVCNYLPARLAALLMIAAAFLLGYDAGAAFRIWQRDRRQHPSPNSAQTEAVAAGALGLRLAGPSCYQGIITDKPYLGDDRRQIEPEDIKRANRLMYLTAWLSLVLALLLRLIIRGVIKLAF